MQESFSNQRGGGRIVSPGCPGLVNLIRYASAGKQVRPQVSGLNRPARRFLSSAANETTFFIGGARDFT